MVFKIGLRKIGLFGRKLFEKGSCHWEGILYGSLGWIVHSNVLWMVQRVMGEVGKCILAMRGLGRRAIGKLRGLQNWRGVYMGEELITRQIVSWRVVG